MGDEPMMAILAEIVNIVVTAVNLKVLGVPIYIYLLLNLIVGGVVAVVTRGD